MNIEEMDNKIQEFCIDNNCNDCVLFKWCDLPSHYCREDGMERIDEMLLIFGKSAVMSYCLLNSWKYRYIAADKSSKEDVCKSNWYIKKYKELKELVDNE